MSELIFHSEDALFGDSDDYGDDGSEKCVSDDDKDEDDETNEENDNLSDDEGEKLLFTKCVEVK